VRKSTYQTSLKSAPTGILYIDQDANKGKSIEERLELVVQVQIEDHWKIRSLEEVTDSF
jgi:hypothetical protein